MGERVGSGERGSWKGEVKKEAACGAPLHFNRVVPRRGIHILINIYIYIIIYIYYYIYNNYVIYCSTFCTSYCLTIISYVRSIVYWSRGPLA